MLRIQSLLIPFSWFLSMLPSASSLRPVRQQMLKQSSFSWIWIWLLTHNFFKPKMLIRLERNFNFSWLFTVNVWLHLFHHPYVVARLVLLEDQCKQSQNQSCLHFYDQCWQWSNTLFQMCLHLPHSCDVTESGGRARWCWHIGDLVWDMGIYTWLQNC